MDKPRLLSIKAQLLGIKLGVDVPSFLEERLREGKTFRDIEFEIRTALGEPFITAMALNTWAHEWGLDIPRAKAAS